MNKLLLSSLALASLAACGEVDTTQTEAIGRDKVAICKTSGGTTRMIEVSSSAVAGQLRSGATVAPTWYADLDEDCQGDPNDSIVSCDQPSGYVDNADDADDDSVCSPDGAMPSDKTIGVEDDEEEDSCCGAASSDLAALEKDYEEVGAESADSEGEEDVEEY